MFVSGWLAGLGVVGAIMLAVAAPGTASQAGAPAAWVSWVRIALGLLLLLLAARQFRSRPRDGEDPPVPKWMATVDSAIPVAAAGRRRSVRRQPQEAAAGRRRGSSDRPGRISGGQQAIACLVFALIATAGIGTPVALHFAMGKRPE